MNIFRKYGLLMTFMIFILCLISSHGVDVKEHYATGFSLNSKSVLSFIKINNNVNTYSSQKNSPKNNIILVINTYRTTTTDENYLLYTPHHHIDIKKHNKLLYANIKNFSCSRVIHPPLEKLCILLI